MIRSHIGSAIAFRTLYFSIKRLNSARAPLGIEEGDSRVTDVYRSISTPPFACQNAKLGTYFSSLVSDTAVSIFQ